MTYEIDGFDDIPEQKSGGGGLQNGDYIFEVVSYDPQYRGPQGNWETPIVQVELSPYAYAATGETMSNRKKYFLSFELTARPNQTEGQETKRKIDVGRFKNFMFNVVGREIPKEEIGSYLDVTAGKMSEILQKMVCGRAVWVRSFKDPSKPTIEFLSFYSADGLKDGQLVDHSGKTTPLYDESRLAPSIRAKLYKNNSFAPQASSNGKSHSDVPSFNSNDIDDEIPF